MQAGNPPVAADLTALGAREAFQDFPAAWKAFDTGFQIDETHVQKLTRGLRGRGLCGRGPGSGEQQVELGVGRRCHQNNTCAAPRTTLSAGV